jgi:membrane fusion protein (multidrug efflux system)
MLIEPSKANAHGEHDAHAGHHSHKVFVTAAVLQDVIITQAYVCQIHSSRHIELRALQTGYLEEISVKEGQRVQKGDSLFRINPSLFEARLNADIAEVSVSA